MASPFNKKVEKEHSLIIREKRTCKRKEMQPFLSSFSKLNTEVRLSGVKNESIALSF